MEADPIQLELLAESGDLQDRITEHKASPAVNEFFELADALLPQPAGGEG
jgi:hypothetical protein